MESRKLLNLEKVVAIKISQDTILDVGTPESYKEAIELSYSLATERD